MKGHQITRQIILSRFAICLIMGLLIFSNHCSERHSKKELSLKKELEIGLLEGDVNYVFGLIADAKVNSYGDIYVLDTKMSRIVKYDRDGRFVLRFGSKGLGPGEFEYPRAITLDSSGRVYVLDSSRIIIFDGEGAFLRSFRIDFVGIDIALDDKENLIILGARNNRPFNVYNKEGTYLYSFGDLMHIPEELSNVKNVGLFRTPLRLWTKQNRIFVMNPYEYEIYIYENEKQIDTLTRRSADYLKPEIREDIPGGFSGVVSGNFIFESDHKIFVFYDGKRASWLDVFEDRKMAASVQVKGSLFAIDHQGKFYFIENTDYPKIVRYSAFGL